MNIRKLTSQSNNDRYATIELSYEELVCINNSLTKLLSLSKNDTSIKVDSTLKAIKRNFVMLTILVKSGSIPAFECGLMHSLDEEIAQEKRGD